MSASVATRLSSTAIRDLDPYAFMAVIGKRVIHPGGRVLTTEFLWRTRPTAEARQVFPGEVCPGLNFDTLDDWVRIYEVRDCTLPGPRRPAAGFTMEQGHVSD